MNDLLQKVKKYVVEEYSQSSWADFDYHNIDHITIVVEEATELASLSHLNEEDTQVLLVAAWFHDLGYVQGQVGHEKLSAHLAGEFLKEHSQSETFIKKVKSTIIATTVGFTDFNSFTQKLMHDADLSHAGRSDFGQFSNALRTEWFKKLNRSFTDLEWDESQVYFLSNLSYLTPAAVDKFDNFRMENLSHYSKEVKRRKSFWARLWS